MTISSLPARYLDKRELAELVEKLASHPDLWRGQVAYSGGRRQYASIHRDEYVDIWLKQNGKDVDNSGCRQAIKDPKFTTVLVSQGIAECKAGDVFSVAVSASSPGKGLGIVAMKPKGEPAIPSIIFSMYKIN